MFAQLLAKATVSTSTLSVGSHSITAEYPANIAHSASISPALMQVVSPLASAPQRRNSATSMANGTRADMLFRRGDGLLAIFFMNGLQIANAQIVGSIGTDWKLVGIGDFNGDGRADLMFRRPNGQLSMFLMNGARSSTRRSSAPSAPTGTSSASATSTATAGPTS